MSLRNYLGAVICLLIPSLAVADQWKPLCIEGSSCSAPYNAVVDGSGPLVTSDGILLLHDPVDYSECTTDPLGKWCMRNDHVFQISASGTVDLGSGYGSVSDSSAVELASGTVLNFNKQNVAIWQGQDGEVEWVNWTGQDGLNSMNDALINAPVLQGDTVYNGLQDSGGGSTIFKSIDEGITWTKNRKEQDIPEGGDRINLLGNPENDALWFINWEVWEEFPPSLWESTDEGKSWNRVDDGSFPSGTLRIAHDPEAATTSYALTDHGLFITINRGVTWSQTSQTESVRSLVFIEAEESSARSLIIATGTGILASDDEGASWVEMSSGLLAQPYTVTFAHGILLASSQAGYFTCNSLDCFGEAQPLQPEDENGIVEVVEFYNSDLDHYFITGTNEEASLIDQGKAGPGWERTGETFTAWSQGSWEDAVNVCRFYGSMKPGPNSHFYSVTPQECRFLMNLQEIVPGNRARWNFEGYAFSALPPAQNEQMPCPESTVPVYRAYNNGFDRKEDSNHRYMVDPELMNDMVAQGWIDEGVAFCSPAE